MGVLFFAIFRYPVLEIENSFANLGKEGLSCIARNTPVGKAIAATSLVFDGNNININYSGFVLENVFTATPYDYTYGYTFYSMDGAIMGFKVLGTVNGEE